MGAEPLNKCFSHLSRVRKYERCRVSSNQIRDNIDVGIQNFQNSHITEFLMWYDDV